MTWVEKVSKPIEITEDMVITKEYMIPIDPYVFQAIIERDNRMETYEETMAGELEEVLFHGFIDYDAMLGPRLFLKFNIDTFDEDKKVVEKIINDYIYQAKVESDFFAEGEEDEH